MQSRVRFEASSPIYAHASLFATRSGQKPGRTAGASYPFKRYLLYCPECTAELQRRWAIGMMSITKSPQPLNPTKVGLAEPRTKEFPFLRNVVMGNEYINAMPTTILSQVSSRRTLHSITPKPTHQIKHLCVTPSRKPQTLSQSQNEVHHRRRCRPFRRCFPCR